MMPLGAVIALCFSLCFLYIAIAIMVIGSSSRDFTARQMLGYGLAWPLLMCYIMGEAMFAIAKEIKAFLGKCIRGE